METTAVVLALAAALSWGLSDFLGGLKSRSSSLLSVLLVSQFTALVVLSVWVLVRGAGVPGGGVLGSAALAGLGEGVGIAALYRGLAVGRMTVVAPLAATAPALPLLWGLAHGDVPGPVASVGLVLAAAGAVITSVRPDPAGAAQSRLAPSVGYGLLAAAGFGSFFLFLNTASGADVLPALLTARLTSVVAVAAVAAVTVGISGRLRLRTEDLPVLALIGVVIVVADFSYATATTQGPLGVAAVLGSLHTVVTVGLATFILDERLERGQRLGVATVLLGVLAIATSPA